MIERFRLNLEAHLLKRRQNAELRASISPEAAASLIFSVLMSPMMTRNLIENTVDCLSTGIIGSLIACRHQAACGPSLRSLPQR